MDARSMKAFRSLLVIKPLADKNTEDSLAKKSNCHGSIHKLNTQYEFRKTNENINIGETVSCNKCDT